jgi:tricorn protease
MTKRFMLVVIFALALGGISRATDDGPLLLQSPTLSRSQVAFVYGGYIWSVAREGGEARQLTTGGHETLPIFSPDGKLITFEGQYDGNRDVYVMPAEGGTPRRLTWHPAQDVPVAWTPDGKRILFVSDREAYADFTRLYTVPLEGGPAEVLPMWRGLDGWYSPDGSRLAYVPNIQWQGTSWKRYRGGQTTPVYLIRLKDLQVERVPRDNSNDSHPVWVGDTVYFLSDRNGPVSLFSYDTRSKSVKQLIENKGLDLKSLSAGPDALVYEQFGEVFIYDPASSRAQKLNVTIAGDLPATRAHFEKLAENISNAGISPTGVRAVFEVHGEIVTVPGDKGDIRNLTRTTGVAERDPAWSPDGKWIAYFSDESGEYALHLAEQSGFGSIKKISLGDPPSFFYTPVWSPDSKKILYTDKRLNLWYVDVDKGAPVKIVSDRFEDPTSALTGTWSPDSKWITYAKYLENHLRAVCVYSLETGKESQITDGVSDSRYPVFDKGGKLLLFATSTDVGLSSGWLDLSSYQHPVLRSVYAAVLKKGDTSPLEPQSDEEKIKSDKDDEKKSDEKTDKGKAAAERKDEKKDDKKDDKKDEKKDEPVKVVVDLEGISQRVVALPVRPGNYTSLDAGKAGTLFVSEVVDVPRFREPTPTSVSKFDFTTRKAEPFVAGIDAFAVSANGEKALYKQGPNWFITPTAAVKPGDGQLKLEDLQIYVDPRAEWNQMYREVWRIQRDFLYDPSHHGLNIPATSAKYQPYLKNLGGRADLNYLFDEMLGEVTIGHMFIRGGAVPKPQQVSGGLLGADYQIANGRYRFARIFSGENWNPDLKAPLTQPGVEVKTGDYLLEVNGHELRPPADLYSFFENTAGKQTRIKVGPHPDGKDSREVTVVPVGSEFGLRNRAWEEDNRRKVDELSGGKLAYVHVPDTNVEGYRNFNRFYFSQVGKQAAIIDERYNHGGQVADYIIDELERPLRNCAISREGEKFCSPLAQIYGPKTMIINEMSGSGGDALPWMFKQDKVGLLVGTRTWGGLVGIYGYPQLIDGGSVTAPRVAIYGLHGDWEVENHGIAPDVEVENDPASVAAGHDPQLERAVQLTLEALKKSPVVIPDHPAYPNYHPN